jgi:hypothetical protein
MKQFKKVVTFYRSGGLKPVQIWINIDPSRSFETFLVGYFSQHEADTGRFDSHVEQFHEIEHIIKYLKRKGINTTSKTLTSKMKKYLKGMK